MKKSNHIYGIDFLRTLAIVGVTLFHVFPNTVKGGYLGVCLFYVLTGYLLVMSSKKRFNIIQYYKKRIKRIYPSLIVVILTTCGLCFFLSKSSLSGIKPEIISILGGYNNLWQISQNSDYFTKAFNSSPFTHFWFLGIELQYYLIWPFLFFASRFFNNKGENQKTIHLFGTLILISVLLMFFKYNPNEDVTRLYYGTDTRVFSLLLGSLYGFLHFSRRKKYKSSQIKAFGMMLLISLLCTFILYFTLDGQSAFLYRGGMFLISLLFVFILHIITNPKLPYGKLLELPVISAIGKYSFHVYLWQYPILYLFTMTGATNIPCYQLLEIVLVIIFSIGLEKVLTIQKLKHKKKALILVAITFILMAFGLYGILTSTDEKNNEMKQMQEEIEKNSEKQKQSIEEKKNKSKGESNSNNDSEYCSTNNALLIGDSILLRSYTYVEDLFPDSIIDGEVARNPIYAEEIYDSYLEEDVVGNTVVICLGTNGYLNDDIGNDLIKKIGNKKDIFWVNVFSIGVGNMEQNNACISSWCEKYDNLHLVDWYSLCNKNQHYLSGDGFHPNEEGAKAWAQLIYDTVSKTKKHNN